MKSLIIAAAVAALALPAFAAENDKAAAQPRVEKTAQEQEQAATKAETEKLASEGISKDVTLVNGASASTPGNGASKAQERTNLRFQDWVHDEDNEYGY